MQTEWQLHTGRDKLKPWNTINHSLTAEPFKIFESYLDRDSRACENNQLKNKKLCNAWLDFFVYADLRKGQKVDKKKGNSLLWRAHEISIEETLKTNPGLLEDVTIPLDERLYLKGWIRFVHVLATSKLPTSEDFVRLLAAPTSPQCSPLGASHCLVENQRASVRFFIKRMIGMGKAKNLQSIRQSIAVEIMP